MGNLDWRQQMADVNDLESALLKVRYSLLVELVSKEWGMDQCDSFGLQRPESSRCSGCRHQDWNAV